MYTINIPLFILVFSIIFLEHDEDDANMRVLPVLKPHLESQDAKERKNEAKDRMVRDTVAMYVRGSIHAQRASGRFSSILSLQSPMPCLEF